MVGDDNDFDYATFLGFVGLINVVLLIPIMMAMHVWGIQEFIMPSMAELASQFGYSLLSCFAFEYFWAKCATMMGPIEATIGSTAFFIPVSLALDFLVWPEPG